MSLIDELERLYAEATPGPWHQDSWLAEEDGPEKQHFISVGQPMVLLSAYGKQGEHDVELVSRMHSALPKLLAFVRAFEAGRKTGDWGPVEDAWYALESG